MKDMSLSDAKSRELRPNISVSGLPSSSTSRISASSDNLKLVKGDTGA
jgi:hypothetical protein